MPRIRHVALDQRIEDGMRHTVIDSRGIRGDRAQKKRRMVQVGSSPPHFTTASLHLATQTVACRQKEPEASRSMSASPSAKRKRRIVLVQPKAVLHLRSSSPASPLDDEPPPLARPATLPFAPRLQSPVRRDAAPTLAQRHAQLDRSDPSSPIGTFGAQMIGRSGRTLRSSFVGASVSASRPPPAKTVGLRALNRPSTLRALPNLPETIKGTNENAPLHRPQTNKIGGASKHPAEEDPAKPKRRRAKIQRVQLGRDASLSPAELPLCDADHQLNSQPDAADEDMQVADESEISYFPTLRPTRPSSDDVQRSAGSWHDQAASAPAQDAEEPRIIRLSQAAPSTSTSDQARSMVAAQLRTSPQGAEQEPDDDQSGVGLLQLLSQSSMRRFDQVQTTSTSPSRQRQSSRDNIDSSDLTIAAEAQHEVQVDFDPGHFTEAQAQRIAGSVIGNSAKTQRWSSCHPDSVSDRVGASTSRASTSRRLLQAISRPPTTRTVCRDLGLSSIQMLKGPLSVMPDFVHLKSGGPTTQAGGSDDDLLEPFEHGLRFAGYCRVANDLDRLPRLQPLREDIFKVRTQKRRKEVVKVIVPFSEAALAANATRARFLPPQALSDAPTPRSHADGQREAVLLVWMQSTAHAFFRALEAMMQAGFARSAQSSSSHRNDSTESDLYPWPILHYAAHAQSSRVSGDSKASSHVTLYVHLDRLEEARQKLASLDLGNGKDGSYLPFSDPSVRLLVTSLTGEPLCLI
ncbi:hypothetical protein PSEUBRA_005248 [Kalmanozyma brasiliensis GHG001]|uniref:uncharacterized protein n=1 Tax=Kalmanozyma brasiliensis (strain GHG001) TaxID=1365824 RepID=UPI0028683227|nr:uncharacterized protein PSEUBRA_005248 [Kalmanozyma brasiliensis GHG001]KAF6767493.1 hypothetical protein PSEUBRA_005248 [Kalmanozyma brasiliensis GHG001]